MHVGRGFSLPASSFFFSFEHTLFACTALTTMSSIFSKVSVLLAPFPPLFMNFPFAYEKSLRNFKNATVILMARIVHRLCN